MLSRFSVKKPFVTLVAAIVVILLGIVCINRMKTDLLPQMEMPYVAVITIDAGASPEQVEADATIPLEANLGRLNGLENMYSTSSENYSLIYLEFAEGTNIDAAMVKVSEAINETVPSFPETVTTPTMLQISMDLMATTYVGVQYEDKSIYELSDFVSNTLEDRFKRIDGVASVSSTGITLDQISVSISDGKIKALNNKLAGYINSQMDSAAAQLSDAQSQLDAGASELAAKQKELDDTSSKLDQLEAMITTGQSAIDSTLAAYGYACLEDFETYANNSGDPGLIATAATLRGQQDQLDVLKDKLAQGRQGVSEGQAALNSYASQINSGRAELDEAWNSFNAAKAEALANADVGSALDKDTIAQLIYAQDFSMPAGYIDDASGDQWLLKVGDNFNSLDDLRSTVLFRIEGVGDITLDDVAEVSVGSTGQKTFSKINGEDAILMAVFKASTATTSDVSNAILDAIPDFEEDYPGLKLSTLIDQGAYIRMFIHTILVSLLAGALLAILVLILFLRDVKPAVVIAISIPFSILFALVLMYFANISVNAMTLGALSLATGMLVDNSVVVMENIYRLRARGIGAARASVQGARQVTGAIISSTLTTICVFLPAVFTSGTVRQLLIPFALTMAFALLASLLVAMTVVPTLASYIFKKGARQPQRWFQRLQDAYGRFLERCLRHRAVVLLAAGALLVLSIVLCFSSGVTMLPQVITSETDLMIAAPEGALQEEADGVADELMTRIMAIDGVDLVGGIDTGSETAVISSSLMSAGYTGQYQFYITYDDSVKTERAVNRVLDKIDAAIDDIPEGYQATISSDIDMTSLVSTAGISVALTGPDNDGLLDLSKTVMEALETVEGYEKVSNGQEEGDKALRLEVDKDAAARKGLTVAQVYAAIAERLNTSKNSIQLMTDGISHDVTIIDETNPLTVENLMNLEVANTSGEMVKLSEIARLEEVDAAVAISRRDGVRSMTVTAQIVDGYSALDLADKAQAALDKIDVPKGYTVAVEGESEDIYDMLWQMLKLAGVGAILIYLIMVAQFQALLAPFIIIFTVPLAFTGGMIALYFSGQQISIMSLLGFVLLMGTVVNNGIVLVDYVNQLRLGGLSKRDALVAAGKTRMRPIMITALTTILAMCGLIFSPEIGSSLQRGMATVVAGGLLYATFMTLLVLPVIYDILSRKEPKTVDLGPESIDDIPDDAAEYLASLELSEQKRLEAGVIPETPAGKHHAPKHLKR